MAKRRRVALVVGLATAVVVALASCSAGTGTSSNTTPTEVPAVAGGTLRIVVGTEPRTLNPVLGLRYDSLMSSAVVERLASPKDHPFEPTKTGLATDWKQTSDLTWEVSLRNGVTFQDGTPFNAAAAVFSIDHMRTQTGPWKSQFSAITKVRAIDDLTVEISTSIPSNNVSALLTTTYALPPGYYTKVGAEAFGRAPVGTGPFKFVKWDGGRGIEVTRSDTYWRGKPYLDGITFSFATEASTRAGLLATGDADVATTIPVSQLDVITNNDSLKLVTISPSVSLAFVQINTLVPPFNNKKVREAAARAIDRDRLIKAIFGGEQGSLPALSLWPSVFELPESTTRITYDLAKAKALLAEVGPIEPIKFRYTTGRYQSDKEIGDALSGMLEAAGFKVERTVMDGTDFITQKNSAKGMDGAWYAELVSIIPSPDLVAKGYLTSNASSHYCGEGARYDDLTNRGLAAKDTAARNQIFAEMNKIVTEEALCFVPIAEHNVIYGVSKKVQGFKPAVDELIDYYPVNLVK